MKCLFLFLWRKKNSNNTHTHRERKNEKERKRGKKTRNGGLTDKSSTKQMQVNGGVASEKSIFLLCLWSRAVIALRLRDSEWFHRTHRLIQFIWSLTTYKHIDKLSLSLSHSIWLIFYWIVLFIEYTYQNKVYILCLYCAFFKVSRKSLEFLGFCRRKPTNILDNWK